MQRQAEIGIYNESNWRNEPKHKTIQSQLMSGESNTNETLARQLSEQKAWNGLPITVGAFVAISDGRVLGIGASYEQADRLLHAAGIPPGQGMICEITDVEADVIR